MNQREEQPPEDTEISHMTFGNLIQGGDDIGFTSVFLKYSRYGFLFLSIALNTLPNRYLPQDV
jgi:hypothetical protein